MQIVDDEGMHVTAACAPQVRMIGRIVLMAVPELVWVCAGPDRERAVAAAAAATAPRMTAVAESPMLAPAHPASG